MEQFNLLRGTVFYSHIPLIFGSKHSKLCAQRAGEASGVFFFAKKCVGSAEKPRFWSLSEINLFGISSKTDQISTFLVETSSFPVGLGMPLIGLAVANPRECFGWE